MSNELTPSSATDVAAFLKQVCALPAKTGQGRLIFALDATASRQPAWDQACELQGAMFEAVSQVGGLQVQLVWYRGQGEFKASRWFATAAPLKQYMVQVRCAGGLTQIQRVLDHAALESKQHPINALVFVGDCVEESPAELYTRGGQLALLGIPVFSFHEGGELGAAAVLRELSSLTGGAYCPFDQGSAAQLKALLSAVAVYATGGRAALEHFSRNQGKIVKQLVHQIK
jgi:hypothetical protein